MNDKPEKIPMTVDDALYICMFLSLVSNTGETRLLRGRSKRKLFRFVFRNKELCESAADRFKAMTDDARAAFFSSYRLHDNFKEEIEVYGSR